MLKHAVIISGVFCLAVSAGYSPNLLLDDNTDRFVTGLCTRYGVPLPLWMFSRPYNVDDVLRFSLLADSLDTSRVLSRAESYGLERLKKTVKSGRSLLKWRHKTRDASLYTHLSLLATLSPRYTDSASIRIRGILAPGIAGNVGDFSYYSSVNVWTDYWSDTLFTPSDYQPYRGIPHNIYGRESSSNFRSSDILRGGIRYVRRDWLELETAIDYLRQGPAVFYPLTFSGYAPPVTFFRARLDLGIARYVHAFGQLKHQKDKPKYLYTHRLDFSLWKKRLMLGITEVIVNGSTTDEVDSLDGQNALRRGYYGEERDLEWAYMIPFIPYKFAEHYLGDRDNGLISFDANLCYPRGFRWYLEFLIDDISAPWTLFSDDLGNKWGLTAGMQFFGELLSRDISGTLEYSHVEPWVYTHFYGGSHRYTHFDRNLGSPLGPNSDAVVADLRAQINVRHAVGLRFTNERTNRIARGGSVEHVFQDSIYLFGSTPIRPANPDAETKEFLGNNPTRSTRIGITWTYAPFGVFRVDGLVEYDLSPDSEGASARFHGGLVF